MNFAHTRDRVNRYIESREWLGMQITVLRGTDTVLELAAGSREPGVPLTVDDPLRWTCSSKVVTAVLYARLVDAGVIELDAPLTGFTRSVTPAHLLNHCAGLSEDAEEPFAEPYQLVAKHAATEPTHPGFTLGEQRRYSSFANFAVLADHAEQVTGESFTELVAREVLAPAGAHDSGFTAEPAPIWVGDAGMFSSAVGELIPPHSTGSVFPGVGCSGPARDLAHIVRGMSPHAAERPRSAERFVTRTPPFTPCQRSGDTAEWGLGLVVGWSRFGRCVSPVSFGHAGCRSSLVMHDPEHDLTIAVVGNTVSRSLLRGERVKPFVPPIYDDLGLSG